MKIRLHVVVDKEDDAVVEVVQNALNEICSKMSYSPSRLQPSLAGCMEFYATSDLNEDEIDDLLSKFNYIRFLIKCLNSRFIKNHNY